MQEMKTKANFHIEKCPDESELRVKFDKVLVSD